MVINCNDKRCWEGKNICVIYFLIKMDILLVYDRDIKCMIVYLLYGKYG